MTIIDIPADLGLGWWQWRARLKRDICPYCTTKPTKRRRTIEHVTPRAQGGPDDPSIVGACESCNSTRSSTSLLLFLLARLD